MPMGHCTEAKNKARVWREPPLGHGGGWTSAQSIRGGEGRAVGTGRVMLLGGPDGAAKGDYRGHDRAGWFCSQTGMKEE